MSTKAAILAGQWRGETMGFADTTKPDVRAAENLDKRAKKARLRLMKERNENYIAELRAEQEAGQESTDELRVPTELMK